MAKKGVLGNSPLRSEKSQQSSDGTSKRGKMIQASGINKTVYSNETKDPYYRTPKERKGVTQEKNKA